MSSEMIANDGDNSTAKLLEVEDISNVTYTPQQVERAHRAVRVLKVFTLAFNLTDILIFVLILFAIKRTWNNLQTSSTIQWFIPFVACLLLRNFGIIGTIAVSIITLLFASFELTGKREVAK